VGNICEAQNCWGLSVLRFQFRNDFNVNAEGASILESVFHSFTQHVL